MTPDEIRAWRQRLGLTQARAAESLGVSPRYVEMLEAGDRTPSQTLINFMRCMERQYS
jgi:transcriptional regulator with XRE-family HTH domain